MDPEGFEPSPAACEATVLPNYFHTETSLWIVFSWELGESNLFHEQKIDDPKKQEGRKMQRKRSVAPFTVDFLSHKRAER